MLAVTTISVAIRSLSGAYKFGKINFPEFFRFSRPSNQPFPDISHNRFTAGLEYVRVHPGQQVPER